MNTTAAGTPLSSFLARLVWLSLLPMILLVVWLGVSRVQALQAKHLHEAEHTVNHVRDEVDRYLLTRLATLEVLAGSPLLENNQLEPFHRRAREIQGKFGGHIIVADPDLQMLLNTRVPFGTPLPRLPQAASDAVAPHMLATGKAQVSNIIPGPVAGELLVAIVVPVLRDGKVSHLLVSTFDFKPFQEVIHDVWQAGSRTLLLQDGQGQAIVRIGAGSPADSAAQQSAQQFLAHSEVSRWSVRLDIPAAEYRAPLLQAVGEMIVALLLALLAGWLGGRWAGRHLGIAVAALTQEGDAGRAASTIEETGNARQLIDAQRNQLQDALASAERFREALEQVDASVYMKDRESRFFYANRHLLKLLNSTPDSLMGAPPERFYAPATASHIRAIDQRVLAGQHTAEEIELVMADGTRSVVWDVKTPIYVDAARTEVWGISGIATDITAYKALQENLAYQNRRSQILLDLPGLADSLDEFTFMQRGLELAEDLTDSLVSFIHFVNADQASIELVTWSRRTLESYCTATFDRHYPVSQAGLWAEALRQRQPVIYNDYPNAPDQRGLPAGHAALERLISLPVIEQDKVVMLAGVGNKATHYTARDVETLQLLANDVWRVVQRKRSIQKLEHFSRMINRSFNEIYTFDAVTLRFVDVNQGACHNLGYTLDELRTMTPLDIKPRMTADSFVALTAPLLAGKQKFIDFTTVHRRKDGTEYDAEIHLELAEDSNPVFIAVVRDITARLRLEQSHRQLAQAVEQSPESIAIADLDARIQYVNAAFVENTGYSREELLGQNPSLLQSGKTPQASYAALWDALTQGYHWEGELFNRRKDGSEYVEWARISPIRQPDGRITHYLAIKQDITARRQAELTLAENLARQRELNRKLEAAQNQLLQSEKMAAIGQLAAGVAHELNNPIGFVNSNLNTLDGYLKDLFAIADAYTAAEAAYSQHSPLLDQARALKQEKDYDFLREDIFQLVSESRDGLTRVAKIVRDLKDFSRAGDATMQWADLHAGIDSTLNIVWNELKYKCTVTKQYGPLPRIWCEPSQLNQVFMNLLVNAGHAIPEKGEITITTGCQDEQVFVAIGDSGSGIAPEHLSRIFDPFFTTKPVGKGTGLGLSLAYSIVQKHQGRIEVRSELGQGTTFTVWLPIKPGGEGPGAVSPVLTLEQP